jgi:hypothetical protein
MTTFAGRGVPAESSKPEIVHNEKPSGERFWIVYETVYIKCGILI